MGPWKSALSVKILLGFKRSREDDDKRTALTSQFQRQHRYNAGSDDDYFNAYGDDYYNDNDADYYNNDYNSNW